MARIRKFVAYRNIERPYTRISKFNKKNFVRGGRPHMKVIKFDMGKPQNEYDSIIQLKAKSDLNIRHNAMEAARMTSNRLLEKNLGKEYHLRIKMYPHHILRENALASGAGADRLSTGMKKSYGKSVGSAARIKTGQVLMELRINKGNIRLGKEALSRAAKKFPCGCKVSVVGLA